MSQRRARLDPATAAIRTALRRCLAGADWEGLAAEQAAAEPAADSQPAPAQPAPAPERHAIIAVSGGADSMALADAAAFLHTSPRPVLPGQPDVRFSAATVEHGLQPVTAEVCALTAEHLRAAGLPTEILRVSVPADSPAGPEAAARSARYTALEAHRADLGATAVLTAHTRDDQAETVLLGLARGSGTRSIAGMRPYSHRLWRPLLEISRAQTAAAARARGLPVWQDPMNTDLRYARVRTRMQALPALEAALGPGIAAALARTGALAADDTDALDDWAHAAHRTHTSGAETDAALAGLPAAVRRRVLRSWLHTLTGTPEEVTAGHLHAVDALLTGAGRGAVSVPGGAEVVRTSRGAGPAGLRFRLSGADGAAGPRQRR